MPKLGRYWACLALFWVCCGAACAASDFECLRYALYKEARSEGVLTQRAVLDVIKARMKASGKSACNVLREPQQFPYFKHGVKKVSDKQQWVRYHIVSGMDAVLPESYIYFNHGRPHPWGRATKRIGNLYFSK